MCHRPAKGSVRMRVHSDDSLNAQRHVRAVEHERKLVVFDETKADGLGVEGLGASQAASPARSSRMIATAMSSDPAAKTSPTLSDGGPQTSEEIPAAADSETAQAARTGGPHRRHQKLVSTLSKLSTPHASCTAVSTCWPNVTERGSWWSPPESVSQATVSRSSAAPARRKRRTPGRRFLG